MGLDESADDRQTQARAADARRAAPEWEKDVLAVARRDTWASVGDLHLNVVGRFQAEVMGVPGGVWRAAFSSRLVNTIDLRVVARDERQVIGHRETYCPAGEHGLKTR